MLKNMKAKFYRTSMLGFTLFLMKMATIAALPACDSEIWCNGPLFEAVQSKGLYNDSKTYVDMNLKVDTGEVTSAYTSLAANASQSQGLTKAQLREFLTKYFEGPDKEFEHWVPTDSKENPEFLKQVKDGNLREFGKALCKKWSLLGRKIRQDVRDHQERYSLLYLDKPFIVPGGRFRETYYWDSYWVVKGLLACEMTTTVKSMLENFASLVQRFGMVPNGNRRYYTRRSQPPFLIPMVDLYMQVTQDNQFLNQILPVLEAEYMFWKTNRSVQCCNGRNQNVTVNRYAAPITMPRPESYKEDVETQHQSKVANTTMYQNLASGAESGWDFSSRWFSENFQKETSDEKRWLPFTDTTNVIPVDLNSILCWNEELLAKFYNLTGNHSKSEEFMERHHNRVSDITNLFWDEEEGVWFDVTLSTNGRRSRFFPSNVFPLYTGCYMKHGTHVEEKVLTYLKRVNVLDYVSGVPTSLLQTGQQWDYPNAWPPLQDVVISALINMGLPESRKVALKLANRWVASNYDGWKRTNGNMFEKYIVTAKGSRGSGGEYNVQEGFGWTNGVILDFLARFGQELSLDYSQTSGVCYRSYVQPVFLCFTVTLFFIRFFVYG